MQTPTAATILLPSPPNKYQICNKGLIYFIVSMFTNPRKLGLPV